MKKLFILMMTALIAIPVFAEERPISAEQLPVKVQTFIAEYFKGNKIAKAQIEQRAALTQYEAELADGTKLQFNRAGNWTEVKRKNSAVPEALIPEKILAYVKATYPDAYIKMIEHDDRLYEIDLSNNIKMTFSSSFRLLDIDK